MRYYIAGEEVKKHEFEDVLLEDFLRYDELGLVLIDKNFNKHRVAEYVQEPCEELEVIGNIFDELLEVNNDKNT